MVANPCSDIIVREVGVVLKRTLKAVSIPPLGNDPNGAEKRLLTTFSASLNVWFILGVCVAVLFMEFCISPNDKETTKDPPLDLTN